MLRTLVAPPYNTPQELVAVEDYLACQMAAYTADLEIYINGQFTDDALRKFSSQINNIQDQLAGVCPIMNWCVSWGCKR